MQRSFLVGCLFILPNTLAAQPKLPKETQEIIDAGRRYFEAGDCANAYPLLKEAYLQSSQPELLTSIAQCSEFLQLDTSALSAYCAYQTLVPNSPYLATISESINALSTKTQQSCPATSVFLTEQQRASANLGNQEPTPEPALPLIAEPNTPARKLSAVLGVGVIAGSVAGKTDLSRTPISGGSSLPEVVLSAELAVYLAPKLTIGLLGILQVTNTSGALVFSEPAKPTAGLRLRYFYGKRAHLKPFLAGDVGYGRFVERFPTNFGGNSFGTDSTHNQGPFLGLGWGFEEELNQTAAFTGSFTLRGYLADNPVSETENIPLLQANLTLGVRLGR